MYNTWPVSVVLNTKSNILSATLSYPVTIIDLLPHIHNLDSTICILKAGWTQRSESTLVTYHSIDKHSETQEM